MKGIILAGGTGSRLFPITKATSKQLLPVFDKPMIYYPLSVFLYAGIRDILLITNEVDIPRFHALLGDGTSFGVSISYAVQEEANGIAEAFIIGKSFIGTDPVALILGDNIFHGPNMQHIFGAMSAVSDGGLVYGYQVSDPERYGVLALNDEGCITDIIEKPKSPPSSYAVTGVYAYDNTVVEIAQSLNPSGRGELEITDVNKVYLSQGKLSIQLLEKGFVWLDTGTCDSLTEAGHYVQTIQHRQGIQIACLEEIAHTLGYITDTDLEAAAEKYKSSAYGLYLQSLIAKSPSLVP